MVLRGQEQETNILAVHQITLDEFEDTAEYPGQATIVFDGRVLHTVCVCVVMSKNPSGSGKWPPPR